jgi:RNA polymerase sigma-70 factor (ECF subfamily)
MRILHNVHLNRVGKKAKAPPTASIDATEEYVLYARLAEESGPGPEDEVVSKVWDERLLEALDRLPLEFREALVMCDVEEMAYKDIAAALDIPIGTVRSRIARGRGLMARYLGEKKPARP